MCISIHTFCICMQIKHMNCKNTATLLPFVYVYILDCIIELFAVWCHFFSLCSCAPLAHRVGGTRYFCYDADKGDDSDDDNDYCQYF